MDDATRESMQTIADFRRGKSKDDFDADRRQLDMDPLQKEIRDVCSQLSQERSDRAMVLLAMAFVEDLLAELIGRRVAIVDAKQRELAIPRSLETRIRYAEALGVLGPKEAAALQIMRGIRNDFAHSARVRSLECPMIQSKLKRLSEHYRLQFEDPSAQCPALPIRDQFRTVVQLLMIHLQNLAPTVERLAAKTDGDWPFGDPLTYLARKIDQSRSGMPASP